jgi:hypothetical protein
MASFLIGGINGLEQNRDIDQLDQLIHHRI